MAEDAVDQAMGLAGLGKRRSRTEALRIHGFSEAAPGELSVYGSDAAGIREMINENPELGNKIHPDLSYTAAEIVWAVRYEMAQTVEDVLARRTRALFINAKAAVESAPEAARIMARELGKTEEWAAGEVAEFMKVATGYKSEPQMDTDEHG